MKKKNVANKFFSLLLVLSMLLGNVWIPQANVKAKETSSINLETKNQETQETKEKITKKTENATVYEDERGKKRAEIYAQNIRFKDVKGKLRDYDTSLKEIEETTSLTGEDLSKYNYQTTKTDKFSYFPDKIDEKTPVLSEYEKYAVKISPHKEIVEEGKLKKENKKGAKIEYTDQKEDINYQYESTVSGLKESIVLEKKPENNLFKFDVVLKNCMFVSQEDLKKDVKKDHINWQTEEEEDIFIYDTKEDKLIGKLPAAFMIDAEGEYSGECNYDIDLVKKRGEERKYHLTLKVSEKYLKDEKRVYPVTIDPTVTWNTSDANKFSSAYVCATSPNTTYTDEKTNMLCVGKRDNSQDLCRAYLKFDGIQSLLAGMYVEKATMELSFYSASANMEMYVRQVTSEWSASEITYNNQPKRQETLAKIITTANTKKAQVELDAEMLDSRARDKEKMCGYEITTSQNDSDTSSKKNAWIFNSVSINGTSIPKLTVEYYDKVQYSNCPHIKYSIYDSGKTWSKEGEDGAYIGDNKGTNAKPMRAFYAFVKTNGYNVPGVKYRAYYNETGWDGWKSDETVAGDTSKTYNMKAMEMRWDTTSAENEYYNLYYRVYVPGRGWLGWAKNGQTAGDYTSGKYISAMEAVIVPKIKYRLAYSYGGHNDKTNITNQGEFNFHIGDKKRITAIGVRFSDPVLTNNYIINQKVYPASGNMISGSSTRENAINMIGNGTVLTGYSMQFASITNKSRYDLQYVGTSVNPSTKDGSWVKNGRVAGTTSGIEELEVMSIICTPKNYIAGKRCCISKQFKPDEDGYNFVNTWSDFVYSSDYKVPKEKYIALYGEVLGTQTYENEKWNGSCFAMALSSQLYFHKYWNISAVTSNIEKGVEKLYDLYPQYLKKDKKMRDLIEYLQISQTISSSDRPEGSDCFVRENYAEIVNWLQQDTNQSHILYVGGPGKGCHVVVPFKITQKSNGDYDIQVYDCNNPGQTMHATINQAKTTFFYEGYTSASLLNFHKFYKARPELYNVIWRNSVYGENNKYVWKDKPNTLMVVGADKVSIKDESGKELNTKSKFLIDTDDKICYSVPNGKYKISVKNTNQKDVRIIAINSDNSTKYTISEDAVVTVDFTQKKEINTALTTLEKQSQEVNVDTYDKNKNKQHKKFFAKKVSVNNKLNKISYERR